MTGREGVRPYLERASRKAEARFFNLSALRELGQRRGIHRTDTSPRQRLSRQHLGRGGTEQSRHALHPGERGRTGGADIHRPLQEVFRRPRDRTGSLEVGLVELQERRLRAPFASSRTQPRAFPSLGLPAVLISIGRRARTASSDAEPRPERFRIVYADYRNSYYGRLAEQEAGGDPRAMPNDRFGVPAYLQPRRRRSAEPTDAHIRQLLASGLYGEAIERAPIRAAALGGSPRSMRRSPGPITRRGSCGARSR